VIENRPGGGGNLALQAVARAPADGHTLLLIATPHAVNVTLYEKQAINVLRDIVPVASIDDDAFTMVVNPALPVRTVAEFVAHAKANPGKVNMGSSGSGNLSHLAGELFKMMTGTEMVHVPYRGAGPMVTDLVGGQVEFAPAALPTVQQYAANGALRIIGVTGPSRLSFAPDIPTMAEQGMPGYVIETWFAVVAPAKLPPADVKRIHDAFAAAFSSPEVREAMMKQGNSINVSTPEYAASFIKSEIEKFAKLVKKAGIEPQ